MEIDIKCCGKSITKIEQVYGRHYITCLNCGYSISMFIDATDGTKHK